MAEFFIGEVRLFSFPWAPTNWLLCNGATYQIKQYQALASLLGKTYGGDGETTFCVPDLRGRTWYGAGRSTVGNGYYQVGQTFGAEAVTLTLDQMPPHSHQVYAYNGTAAAINPARVPSLYAQPSGSTDIYGADNLNTQPLNPASLESVGGGGPHDNMQPFAVVNFCICAFGVYPPRP